jgi:hypothetical protein
MCNTFDNEVMPCFTSNEINRLKAIEEEKINLSKDIIEISNDNDIQKLAKRIISKANETKNLLY